jgi:hypothetical protein
MIIPPDAHLPDDFRVIEAEPAKPPQRRIEVLEVGEDIDENLDESQETDEEVI